MADYVVPERDGRPVRWHFEKHGHTVHITCFYSDRDNHVSFQFYLLGPMAKMLRDQFVVDYAAVLDERLGREGSLDRIGQIHYVNVFTGRGPRAGQPEFVDPGTIVTAATGMFGESQHVYSAMFKFDSFVGDDQLWTARWRNIMLSETINVLMKRVTGTADDMPDPSAPFWVDWEHHQ